MGWPDYSGYVAAFERMAETFEETSEANRRLEVTVKRLGKTMGKINELSLESVEWSEKYLGI